jgi:benzoate-CoA ligase family protein
MSHIELPEQLNAADVFVDQYLRQGRGEKAAILCGDQTVTYRDLAEGVSRLGNALTTLGVRMEERIAMLLPDSPEWAFVFYGAMKMGAVSVPLNTILKPQDYEYMLNDSRAPVLVVDPAILPRILEVRDRLKYLQHMIVTGDGADGFPRFDDLLADASPELQPAETSKDDAAFWLYSSGTTGFPKGTIHLHHDMIVEADLYARDTIGLQESDVSFSVAKLFFAYGLGNGLYFPLHMGGTTVLLPGRPTPDAVFEVIDRYQPTVFYSVPTSYAALLHLADQTGRTELGRVRMCVSAGETLPAHIFEKWKERFGVEILDGIGSTEILHIFISNRPGQAVPGSTGQIVPGYEARIVDEDRNDVPVRTVGTLLIKGDSIASAYWNKHEQSKRTFFGEWTDTRDKFLQDENGYFWYAGRTDDMMKVSGQAVWPAEVESVLQEHPNVLESGVIGTADPDGLIKPVAYVVLKDSSPASHELARELQQFVKQKTAPHKYPRAVVFVEDLPKTATGKIKRYVLRERAAAETPLHG